MFQKTSLRLAGLYLAIVMIISLFFSINVYRLSTQELDKGFSRQAEVLENLRLLGPQAIARDQFIQRREQDIDNAKSHIISRLVVINLLILIGGGFLSYLLARWSLKPIEESHAAQSRFTADASHELRTPLAAMQTEIEVALLKPNLKLVEAKNQLRSNLEELHKLNQLTEGLLRLSRLDHGSIVNSRVPLESIVNTAITQMLPKAEAKKILIHSQLSDNLVLIGDQLSLVEVLSILLDNAIKYSPPKSEIKLSTNKELRHVVISVVDQGIGIKPNDVAHIYERFYRADSARSKEHVDGYGLGLAIAKNIVDLHKGSITVKGNVGKGTIFNVRLPLA